jgi:dimethylargininase
VKLLVRPPSPAFKQALSEHKLRREIDPQRALQQHAAFVEALRNAGVDIVELAPESQLPDACFVSDTLVLLGDSVVLTRPGAESRRRETDSVARFATARIVAPGTLDGGDVIVYGGRVAIGVSARTNRDGAEQLCRLAQGAGYRAFICAVDDRLHLASAVTVLRPDRLAGTAAGFRSLDAVGAAEETERLLLDDEDVPAANVLAAGGRCFMAAGYPRAAAILRNAGEDVVEVELDEFTKADGGPTCLVALLPG